MEGNIESLMSEERSFVETTPSSQNRRGQQDSDSGTEDSIIESEQYSTNSSYIEDDDEGPQENTHGKPSGRENVDQIGIDPLEKQTLLLKETENGVRLKSKLQESPKRPMISVRKSEDLFGASIEPSNSEVKKEWKSSSPKRDDGHSLQPFCEKVQYSSTSGLVVQLGGPCTNGSGSVMRTLCPTNPFLNLPPGIQVSKKTISQVVDLPLPKRRRGEAFLAQKVKRPHCVTRVSNTSQMKIMADLLKNSSITVYSNTKAPAASPKETKPSLTITQQPSEQAQLTSFNQKLPTVDLTKEIDYPRRRSLRARHILCQVCDKSFPSRADLTQHMVSHRSNRYECEECSAQYPTSSALESHKQKYHAVGGPSPDMAVPVVDLKQTGVMTKLLQLGVRSVIPLAQLHSGNGSGMFALPVVAVDAASNPALCNVGGIGASNLLPLGPLKNLPIVPNNSTR